MLVTMEKQHHQHQLETYHLSYCIYKHDFLDVADPSSMHGTCHELTELTGVAHHIVSVT